jgi:hypothetical protein
MNLYPNTPQYLPILSPLLGAAKNFASPLLSPYAGCQDIYCHQ